MSTVYLGFKQPLYKQLGPLSNSNACKQPRQGKNSPAQATLNKQQATRPGVSHTEVACVLRLLTAKQRVTCSNCSWLLLFYHSRQETASAAARASTAAVQQVSESDSGYGRAVPGQWQPANRPGLSKQLLQ
jgi:hypothetical protein